jgi:hypothetical protein
MTLIIPPVRVTKGVDWEQSYSVEDPTATPPDVDLTGWTARVMAFKAPFDAPFWSDDAEVTIASRIVARVPGEASAAWDALPIIAGRPNAYLQIRLTPADPTAPNAVPLVWQANLTVAGVSTE